MNNFEKIKVKNLDELAKFFCDELIIECFACPFDDECELRPQGFKQWLQSESED